MASQQVVIKPGMSEAIDARQLPIGTPRLIKNYRVRQGARFEKRPGAVDIDGGTYTGFPTSGYAGWVAQHRSLPVMGLETVSTRRGRYAYALGDASTVWTMLGRHGVVMPERRFGLALAESAAGIGVNFSSVAISGVVYVAFNDFISTTSCTLLAVDPNGIVLRRTTISSTGEPRLVYDGGSLYLVYRDTSGAAKTLKAVTVTPSTLAISEASTIGTLNASSSVFDAAPIEGSVNWVVAYPTSAINLRVVRVTGTTTGSTVDQVTGAEAGLIGVAGYNGEHVCVAYQDGTTIEAFVLSTIAWLGTNYTVRAAGAAETYLYQCGVVRTTTSTFAIVMAGTDTASVSPTMQTKFTAHCLITSGGTLTGPYKIYYFVPCSKPFVYGAAGERQVLIWANNNNGSFWLDQRCHYVLELQPTAATGGGANVAAISYEHTCTQTTGTAMFQLSEVADLGSGRLAVPLQWDDPGQTAGIDMAVFRATTAAQSSQWSTRQTLSIGTGLLISGGMLYEADGAQLAADTHYLPENGFPFDPEINTIAAAGGSLTSGQLYNYVAVYRWMDSSGRIHRSAPSSVSSLTPSGGNLTATIRVASCTATGRSGSMPGGVVAEVYRSWLGGPYYYVTEVSVTAAASVGDTSDGNSDVTVSANSVLYTDLGILPTEPPSGARLICSTGTRVFCVGWRPNVAQFSKLIFPTAPVEFTDDDAFRVFLPEDITAIGSMDGAFVAWSERSIYVVTGDGPNDQGVGEYSDPRRLPATVGADFPHVVETAAGLMYKGGGTIWLLPRGFGPPQDIGVDIQETLATYPYLRAAVLCTNDDDDCVHFVLATSDTSAATTIVAVWDNRLNGWFLDDIDGEIGAAGAVDGLFTWMLPTWSSIGNSPVRQFSTSTSIFRDMSAAGSFTWIESRIGFGDWRPFGPLGWGRFEQLQIHGERAGACTLKLDVTVNAGSIDAQALYTVTSTLSSGQFYRVHRPHPEQGNSWRFDIYDAESSGKTAGLVLHSVAFEGEETPGLMRLAESEVL